MSVLNANRPTARIELPPIDPGQEPDWVEMYTDERVGDGQLADANMTTSQITVATLARVITAWSYTLPDNTPAPINPTMIEQLPGKHYLHLIQEYAKIKKDLGQNPLTEDSKKK